MYAKPPFREGTSQIRGRSGSAHNSDRNNLLRTLQPLDRDLQQPGTDRTRERAEEPMSAWIQGIIDEYEHPQVLERTRVVHREHF